MVVVSSTEQQPPGDGSSNRPTLSVCVVTYERAAFLDRCLSALEQVAGGIDDVVVVDASACKARPQGHDQLPLQYVWAPHLAGWMTRSRNEGLAWVTGDVIAFIDDDVVVSEGWADALRRTFRDPSVAAVAGRTLNRIPGEDAYIQPIGRVLPDGHLTEGFATATTSTVAVQHGIGANMAFRRRVLGELGGFRDDYPGTALREDTDIFLRVGRLEQRILYAPEAAVDHLPAPHVHGARFDTRYKLYARRNHVVLLARDQGIGSRMLRRWVRSELANVSEVSGALGRLQRFGVTLIGVAWGTGAALRGASWGPLDPRRRGPQAQRLRTRLSSPDVRPSPTDAAGQR